MPADPTAESVTPVAEDQSTAGTSGRVLTITWAEPIHAMTSNWLQKVVDDAASVDAAALVIQLDTPGGSLPATRRIVQTLLSSPVPVVVFVAPGGAQAASAGFFLLLAADVAAMAPGTNTGAAHPVQGSGEDIEGDMGEKVEQDTLALIRSLAERQGRDLELAQAAVSESRSFTATEALEAGLIDVVADDVPSLLTAIDGREIDRSASRVTRLATAESRLEERHMSTTERWLTALAHPQIAGLLMAFGMLGIYVEITNPGLILPGTIGAICLILGFFAISVLSINFAGLALLGLALVLFIAETQVPTFGVLTLGGAISMALGLSMLADEIAPADEALRWWAWGLSGVVAMAAGFASYYTVRTRSRKPVTGEEGMVGLRGVARSTLDPRGQIQVHGEIWQATAESAQVAEGSEVEVVAVEGLRLRVRALAPPPSVAEVPATVTSALDPSGVEAPAERNS